MPGSLRTCRRSLHLPRPPQFSQVSLGTLKACWGGQKALCLAQACCVGRGERSAPAPSVGATSVLTYGQHLKEGGLPSGPSGYHGNTQLELPPQPQDAASNRAQTLRVLTSAFQPLPKSLQIVEGQVLTLGLEDMFPSLPPPPWFQYSSYRGQAATGTDGQGDVPPLPPAPCAGATGSCYGSWRGAEFVSIHLRCK